ncbi:Nol1 Nop2 Fmu domain containing protein [Trichuris trichiura]|uniref:NOL1/NOP2/Sun domain family member 4 n=1 Tax=Trichuris trichiura TaxID=36087 RepID=A0A077Z551_TRITR|nr:Nol1 Nop2 Fmu domain containing protein [Trichuris trichiura]
MCYTPVYKEKWPSIRLGLLSDPKYAAVINSMAADGSVYENLLQLGTFELFDQIRCSSAGGINESFLLKPEPIEPVEEYQKPVKSFSVADISRRDERAMTEFIQPTKFIAKSVFPIDTTEMSGMEFLSAKPVIPQVSIVPYEVQYPQNLKVMLFPPGDISTFPPSHATAGGSLAYYLLDVASVLPVIALDLKPGETVLDMCASPGGKTILILCTLLPGLLACNDFDPRRFSRLKRTLQFYVPTDSELRRKIVLKRKDAANEEWDELEQYDKILVDAPCTSDRLSSEDDMNLFKRSRMEERIGLPLVQISLIRNGLRSLKPGGSLVYSTCTLSPVQNDAVIESVMQQEDADSKVAVCDLSSVAWPLQRSGIFHFHHCRYGLQVIPSVLSNCGPMYVCKLLKMT